MHANPLDDWYWEGNVVEALCAHLSANGWTIESRADTLLKQRGVDIVATRMDAKLLVEVKGYPPSVYRDPRRAGEKKRTNPTVQAKHWLAEAIFSAMRLRPKHVDAQVAIAVPDFPRYQSLLGEVGSSLTSMGIGIFVVCEDGSVQTTVSER